jgi:DNA-binding NarL/FixJ family response regulator
LEQGAGSGTERRGPNITAKKSRVGKIRLTLRLPQSTIDHLNRLAEDGTTVEAAVGRAVEAYVKQRGGDDAERYRRLSPRLSEVLLLIGQCHTTKEIAKKLGISVKTVEMHRTQLKKTLKTRGIAGLVRFAVRAGVIVP